MAALWHSGEGVLILRQDSPHIRLMFSASCSGIHDSAEPLLPIHCSNSQRNFGSGLHDRAEYLIAVSQRWRGL
jgi:hypothetical protein